LATSAQSPGLQSAPPFAQEQARALGNDIVAVQLGPAPEAFHSDARWLFVTVDSTDGAAGLEARWHALLLAGSYNTQATASGSQDIEGASVIDGRDLACNDAPTSLQCEAPGGLVTGLPPIDVGPWDNPWADVKGDIENRASDNGINVIDIEGVPSGNYTAPVVTIQVDDPRAFLSEHENGMVVVFGDTSRYEGALLKIVDSNGTPVAESGIVSRLWQGLLWVQPDLANALNHGG